MKPQEWWKNFALNLEIDVAGSFVFNGIKALHDVRSLHHPVDSFEILYNLSVGVERLLKVAIILIEHHDQIDSDVFEQGLISHSTIDLAKRVSAQRELALAGVHFEFLSLLSKFYKTHRYGRYSLSAVPEIADDKRLLIDFLSKHLKIPAGDEDADHLLVPHLNQVRKFIGKVVKKICDEVFRVIRKRASELGIFTTELRSDSKAMKVFYGKRLDFIDEEYTKKEFLLFLMSPIAQGAHIDLLRSFEPLDLDPNMAPHYIQALLNDSRLPFVEGEVEVLYEDVQDVRERLSMLELVDNEYLQYDDEGDDEEEA